MNGIAPKRGVSLGFAVLLIGLLLRWGAMQFGIARITSNEKGIISGIISSPLDGGSVTANLLGEVGLGLMLIGGFMVVLAFAAAVFRRD